MHTLNFQLVTPEKTVLSQELVSLTCPTEMGEITILPHHAPLVAALKSGEMHARTEKGDFYLHVAGGFVEVRPGNEVVVLADAAEHHHEIDVKRAAEAAERAKKLMVEVKHGSHEYAKVAAALERSLSRINVARKHSHRKNPLVGDSTLEQ
jgi:F-type H+-transporting ATPase subunit epsilon